MFGPDIHGAFFALFQVILIDITLAGDNAIVIGMVASRLPKRDRRKVIFWGLAAAVVLRILLAIITMQLMQIIGLMLAGGILLLWVAWRFWHELRHAHHERLARGEAPEPEITAEAGRAAVRRAILHVTLADISMSLDNVLAVAGAAMRHWDVLVVGLVLSIALMGFAANVVAKLLRRRPWISYLGLIVVLFVALRMIFFGGVIMLHRM